MSRNAVPPASCCEGVRRLMISLCFSQGGTKTAKSTEQAGWCTVVEREDDRWNYSMSWNARISWDGAAGSWEGVYEDAVMPERTKTGEAVRQQQPMSRRGCAGVVWVMPVRAEEEDGQGDVLTLGGVFWPSEAGCN